MQPVSSPLAFKARALAITQPQVQEALRMLIVWGCGLALALADLIR